jgi:hypothetical protein
VKESELADIIIKYLESKGYEIYSEVIWKPGSKRADIVGVKDGHYISVETKMSMNLTLLEQSFFWKDKVHQTFICIPSKRKMNRFALQLCRDLGIGVYIYRKSQIQLLEDSTTCDNPDLPKLYEEQKDSVSGTSGGNYVTPFKITCRKLIEHVKEVKECSLISAIRSIEHHYSSDNSAKNALHKMINIGVIKLEIFRKGREIWVKY